MGCWIQILLVVPLAAVVAPGAAVAPGAVATVGVVAAASILLPPVLVAGLVIEPIAGLGLDLGLGLAVAPTTPAAVAYTPTALLPAELAVGRDRTGVTWCIGVERLDQTGSLMGRDSLKQPGSGRQIVQTG